MEPLIVVSLLLSAQCAGGLLFFLGYEFSKMSRSTFTPPDCALRELERTVRVIKSKAGRFVLKKYSTQCCVIHSEDIEISVFVSVLTTSGRYGILKQNNFCKKVVIKKGKEKFSLYFQSNGDEIQGLTLRYGILEYPVWKEDDIQIATALMISAYQQCKIACQKYGKYI